MLNRGLECRMLGGMFVLTMFGVAAIRRRCSNARHFNLFNSPYLVNFHH